MSGFPGPSLAAYESGYLGFAPQRELSGLGVDCVVTAVSRVPRSAADLSSKNDRNDAARMAKAILSHDVTPVWVRKGSERLLRRREEMIARGMPQAKANAATAAELVRWLWALGAMCREAGE